MGITIDEIVDNKGGIVYSDIVLSIIDEVEEWLEEGLVDGDEGYFNLVYNLKMLITGLDGLLDVINPILKDDIDVLLDLRLLIKGRMDEIALELLVKE